MSGRPAPRPGLPVLAVLGLLLSPAFAPVARGSPQDGRPDPFATITLQDPQGRSIRLADFKGKVRLIDIWASWCGPCRMIIPHLNRLYDSYRDKGLVVIGVSVDDSPADVVAFNRRIPIKYPSGMMNSDIVDILGYPESVPTTYLVDRTGKARAVFRGFVEPAVIEREVRKYLEPR